MSTPASTIVISAEDKASRIVEQTAVNVDKSVRKIKDVSGRAKASTEFIGVLSRSLGGGELGSYAAELAGMTEKVGQFAEVSKTGKLGALAFKAGLVGLVATVSYGVGKAIGDVIWQTERWTRKLAEATAQSEKLNDKIQSNKIKQFAKELADIKIFNGVEERGAALQTVLKKAEQEADSARQKLEGAQRKAEEWDAKILRFDPGAKKVAANYAEVAEREKSLEVARQNLELVREETGERAKQIAAREKQLELAKAEEAIAQGIADKNKARATAAINLEVATIQKIEERRVALEQGATAARAYALEQQGLTQEIAARLAADEAALDAAQKNTETKKAEDEKAIESAKQLAQLQRSEIDRLMVKRVELLKGADAAKILALQQQGLSKEFAARLVFEEKAIDIAQKERDQRKEAAKQLSGMQLGVQAVQSRLQTRGQAETGIDRVAKLTEKQVRVLEKILEQGGQPQRIQQQVQLVQVN